MHTYNHVYKYLCVFTYESKLKSSYDDIISTVDDFLDQQNPRIATLMEEICGTQCGLYQKINLIWSNSMRVSWSAYELFCQYTLFNKKINLHMEFLLNNTKNVLLIF